MAKKRKVTPGTITNRRASFDYELADSYRVGIVLSGAETKSLRLGHGTLRGAYVVIKDDELWLINATITSQIGIDIADESRPRKLLAKKKEIAQLTEAKKQGLTIVPTKFFTKTRFIKVEIAPGKGKKRFDKRETIKRRDTARDTARTLGAMH